MADVFQLTASEGVPRPWLGDRAYYLSQLAAQPEPILPGVVVSAQLLREVWETTPWRDPLFAELSHSTLHLQTDDSRQLQAIAQQIRQALLNVELPEAIAADLSHAIDPLDATQLIFHPSLHIEALGPDHDPLAIAALLESHVSSSDRASLSQTLKQAWAELFRARCLLYWQRAKIPLEQIYLAILIQPLRPTLVSGFLNLRRDAIEIIATRGLPQSLWNGCIAPERYQIEADSGQIRQHHPGTPLCYYHLCPDSGEIQVVAVGSDRPQGPVLKPNLLRQLRHHAQHFYQHLDNQHLDPEGDRADLEWVLTQQHPDATPTWYISQYYPQGSPSLTIPTLTQPTGNRPSQPSQFQGIAASSGQVYGVVCRLSDLDIQDKTGQAPPNQQILVVPQFEPQDAPPCQHLVGLISESGSRTSHGAIWARELGIPAVMGVANLTQQVETGQAIYLDGDRGQVYLNPAPNLPVSSPIRASSRTPMSPTLRVHGTELFLSFSQPQLAPSLAQLPVDGVGLIRSELLAQSLSLSQYPPPERLHHLSEGLRAIAEAFAPRPVYYRSQDGGRPGQALGLRGTLAYTQDARHFEDELTALAQVQQAGYDNLRLILPFVRSLEEFKAAQTRIHERGLDESPGFQCWLMAEVPSVAVLLDEYVEAGVQGIAIGSHDLSQLILGFDRDDPQVAAHFEVTHPAVLDAIARLALNARRLNIPCTICADSLAPASGDRALEAFIRCGVTGVCLSPDNLENQIRAIAQAEQRLLLDGFWQGKPAPGGLPQLD
ncbi:MAG: hypothetical protein EYR95_03930 [Phormidium sp. SL48-SHIP]|nr:MAG: hypothetical protein EYR95_03930 [Phormidium sp. SL48-SHIP]